MKEKKKLSLAAQIFIAMVLAIVFGLAMQSCAEFANNFIKPFGTIFLNLVKFIVVPIVLFSIMCGIISMSDIRKVGSIGLKTVIYYLCTTAFAVTIGLVGGNLFKGAFPVVATTDLTYDASATTSFMDTLVNIFPSNFFKPMVEANMLQVIVMAVLLGFWVSWTLQRRRQLSGAGWTVLGLLMLLGVWALFLLFTFRAPDLPLFIDPLTGLRGIA